MRTHFATLSLVVAACSGSVTAGPADGPLSSPPDAPLVLGDGGPTGGCITGLTNLTLAPADSMVSLDGGAPAPITFNATGTVNGQSQAIPSSSLAFSATRDDDTPAGTFSGNVLTPNGQAGGTVNVSATDGCVTATTTVHFVLTTSVGTPTDPGPWAGTPVATGAPAWVYPSDQTRFPRNIYRTLFQWRTNGMTQFRLTFDGPGAR